ncbi:MAG TPA: biotin-dependent carboxyltransferase family protein, partial [Thermodesulfobacteriota bacterium]|nr:biotin-dependent carboxyltransferase family protein [Thermodesulfobacteriota bacterium]
MNAFQVIHPGVHTAVQDLGRPGFMKYGTPASGVADRFSARAANWLAGNPENAAVLEVTLYRLELLALADVSIAVTGADLTPAVDNRPLPMWETVRVRKGERFLFRGRKKGLRAYVAVEGGFEAPVFLGSRSVFVRGLMGKALEAGEVLAVAKPRDASPLKRKLPGRMIPPFTRDP